MNYEQFSCDAKMPALLPVPAWTRNWPATRQHLEQLRRRDALHGRVKPQGGIVRKIDGFHYRFECSGSLEQLDLANELVTKRYTWRGYDAEGALGSSCSVSDVTFVATCGGRVDGTLTVRVDGQTPLLAEQLYPKELERLRRRGARLCEFGRLAFDEGVNTLEVLGPLFHLGMVFARGRYDCTDMVIEVNPRHVGFYQRVFGFEVLGDERTCDRVSAPAVLLRLALGEAAFLADVQGGERAGRRSIYPYCLGRTEIAAFRREIASLDAGGGQGSLANAVLPSTERLGLKPQWVTAQ